MELGEEGIHAIIDRWLVEDFALAAEVNSKKAALYASISETPKIKNFFNLYAKINKDTAGELRAMINRLEAVRKG